jgi:hypothetical protein
MEEVDLEGSNLTVLNGSEGVNQLLTGIVGQGVHIYEALRQSIATQASDASLSNGTVPAPSGKARDATVHVIPSDTP